MATKISPLDPLQWYEGMLLTPQMLQQADRRAEELNRFIMQNLLPYYFGIVDMDIDMPPLGTGTFQVKSLSAIFPDGLTYETAPDGSDAPSVNLKPYEKNFTQGPLIISLALPTFKPMQSNVTGDYPRFRSMDSDKAVDINTGENVVDLARLRPNVSFVVGDVPARYTSIPVAKVKLDQGTYILCDDFSPSYVKLTQGNSTGKVIYDILTQMRGKINYLYQKQSSYESSYGSAERGEKNLGPLLEILSSCLLELEALYYSNNMMPYHLYTTLCNLAGRLAPLKPSQLLPFFGAYEHADQYACFSKLTNFILDMLSVLQQGFKTIVFKQSGRNFSLELADGWVTSAPLYVGIRLPSGLSRAEAMTWLDEAVIATDDRVQSVKERRILGAERKVLESSDMQSLALPPDVVLLQVDSSPDFITSGKNLCLFNISDVELNRPREIILYILEDTTSKTQKESGS